MRPIETLLRARWDSKFKKLENFIVVIRHGGAPDNKREINGSSIVKIQKDGFWYKNRFGEEIFIPAHRIIKLKG